VLVVDLHKSVAELTRSILEEGQGLFTILHSVEVGLELSLGIAFSVELVLEVGQELFECFQGRANGDVGDHNRSFKDSLETGLVSDFNDALVNRFGNLRAHRVRHFGALFPEDINCFLLTLSTIGTHIKLEMLIDQQCQILPSLAKEMRPRLCLLLQDNISQSIL